MMNYLFLLRIGFVSGVFLIMIGCAGSAPTKFYSLHSLITAEAAQKAVSADHNIAIGIGPVKIPDYLDRPNIITRTGQHEVNIDDFNKWAGSLKSDISRVLAENLSIILSTDRVYTYPWESYIPLKYRVVVNVTRFDGVFGEDVLLNANWSILGKNGKKPLLINRSSFSEKTVEKSYAALVDAQSRLLENLSRDIADAIKTISQEAPEK